MCKAMVWFPASIPNLCPGKMWIPKEGAKSSVSLHCIQLESHTWIRRHQPQQVKQEKSYPKYILMKFSSCKQNQHQDFYFGSQLEAFNLFGNGGFHSTSLVVKAVKSIQWMHSQGTIKEKQWFPQQSIRQPSYCIRAVLLYISCTNKVLLMQVY